MRVGIVGGGFAGLTVGYRLAARGARVWLFEASEKLGGLASGVRFPGWEWPVERFYHHIFANDSAAIRLSREVGWPPQFYRPTTALYHGGRSFPFDSAVHLLRFGELEILDRLRMGAVLGFLKLWPFWQPLERMTADVFLRRSMGSPAYEMVWKPLLRGKFGRWYSDVNAAWFWARIKKRTPKLGYFREGFQGFADRLGERITQLGGKIYLTTPVGSIRRRQGGLRLASVGGGAFDFDRVVVTSSNDIFLKMVAGFPDAYRRRLRRLRSLDALVVLLAIRKPLLGGAYWLNITDPGHPFLVVIEHTNLIDAKHYQGEHLIYLGNYLPPEHEYFRYSSEAIVRLAADELQRISRRFNERDIVRSVVSRGRGAQPVIPLNYSKLRPSMETPIPGLFLANMSLVYPWDRGTNYAILLGERVAAELGKS